MDDGDIFTVVWNKEEHTCEQGDSFCVVLSLKYISWWVRVMDIWVVTDAKCLGNIFGKIINS